MKLILYSQDDIAGKNIISKILEKRDFTVESPTSYIYGDIRIDLVAPSVLKLDTYSKTPELCFVASRHRSEVGGATLTVHPTGNFGTAELGGNSNSLQYTNANYMEHAYRHLIDLDQSDYAVSREVTHHGPTNLPFPLFFIEVGSTSAQWNDMNACEFVADTILSVCENEIEKRIPYIGFGGPHYAPNFNTINSKYSCGHIMPNYFCDNLTKVIVLEMIEKTIPKPEFAAIDWKGLKGMQKNNLKNILDELGFEWVKTSDLK